MNQILLGDALTRLREGTGESVKPPVTVRQNPKVIDDRLFLTSGRCPSRLMSRSWNERCIEPKGHSGSHRSKNLGSGIRLSWESA